MSDWFRELFAHFPVGEGLAMGVLIVLSAFFSSSETALFSLDRSGRDENEHGEKDDEDNSDEASERPKPKNPLDRQVDLLLADESLLLTAILFCNLLINMSYFSVSVVATKGFLAENLGGAAAAFGVLGMAMLILFGEVLPKQFALAVPAAWARTIAVPMRLVLKVLGPVAARLARISEDIRTGLFSHLKPESFYALEDTQAALNLEYYRRLPHRQRQLREIIWQIVELSEQPVTEEMWPRERSDTGLEIKPRPKPRKPNSNDAEAEAKSDGESQNDAWLVEDLREPARDAGFAILLDRDGQPRRFVNLMRLADLAQDDLYPASHPLTLVSNKSMLARCLDHLRPLERSVVGVVDEFGTIEGFLSYEMLTDIVLRPEVSRLERVYNRNAIQRVPGPRETYQLFGRTTIRRFCDEIGEPYQAHEDGVTTIGGVMQEAAGQMLVPSFSTTYGGFELTVLSPADESTKDKRLADDFIVRAVRLETDPERPPGPGETDEPPAEASDDPAASSDEPPTGSDA